MSSTQLLSIRVSKEHHKELKRIAVEEETSLNDIVYTLIKDYLAKRK